MTDPRSAPAPGSDEVVSRIESAARDVAGVSDGPLTDALSRLDALHRDLQGALADLDQA